MQANKRDGRPDCAGTCCQQQRVAIISNKRLADYKPLLCTDRQERYEFSNYTTN